MEHWALLARSTDQSTLPPLLGWTFLRIQRAQPSIAPLPALQMEGSTPWGTEAHVRALDHPDNATVPSSAPLLVSPTPFPEGPQFNL
jgi:hypothetical protein